MRTLGGMGLKMFTLGQWIILGVLFFVGIIIGILVFEACESKVAGIATIIGTVVIVGALAFGMNWYNTSTASGIRGMKDFKSELTNGIEREIMITAEDGREIFHYQGKVDVESDHTDNYIKFESEEGKRYLIYYGIQDTITIIEK